MDDVGIEFAAFLLDAFFGESSQQDIARALPGLLLERWVLKVIVGAMASGSLKHDNEPLAWQPSPAWNQVLFGRAYPAGLGLCFAQIRADPYRGHLLGILTLEEEIAGGIFELMGVRMVAMPDSIGGLGMQEKAGAVDPIVARPDKIQIENSRGKWQLDIEWPVRGPEGRALLLRSDDR